MDRLKISQQKKQLSKWDKAIAAYLDNVAVSQWKDVDTDRHKDVLHHIITRGPSRIQVSKVAKAQQFFRIHPSKKTPFDTFTVLEKIREAIELITNAEIRDDLDSVKEKVAPLFVQISRQMEGCAAHAKLLQMAGESLKTPPLSSLFSYTVSTLPMPPEERKQIQKGSDLYNMLQTESSNEFSLSQYVERASGLIQTYQKNKDAIVQFQKDTNPMIGVVIRDYYIEPIILSLDKIKNCFTLCKKNSEPIMSDAEQIRIELITDYTHSDMGDYLVKIDTYRDRIIQVTSSLSGLSDVIEIIEISKTLIDYCGALNSSIIKIMNDLAKQYPKTDPLVCPITTAEKLRKQYYFGGFMSLLKLLFAEKVTLKLIETTIGNCPVRILKKDGKNIKDMKDIKMLENYLRNSLYNFSLSWFHRNLSEVIKGGIVEYTRSVKEYINGVKIKSPFGDIKHVGSLTAAIATKIKRLP